MAEGGRYRDKGGESAIDVAGGQERALVSVYEIKCASYVKFFFNAHRTTSSYHNVVAVGAASLCF